MSKGPILNYRYVDTAQAVGDAAADTVIETLKIKPDAVIVFPTGNTPLPMYAELRKADLDWSRSHLFHLDEYVPTTPHYDNPGLHQAQTYGAYMNRELWGCPALRTADRHYFQDYIHKPVRYEAQIEALGGADLIILGIGLNGHIAFIEPGFDPKPESQVWQAHRIQLAETTINANFPDKRQTGFAEEAVTLGLQTILSAKQVLLLASGENKIPVIREAFSAQKRHQPPTVSLPASYLRAHPNLTIIANFACP